MVRTSGVAPLRDVHKTEYQFMVTKKWRVGGVRVRVWVRVGGYCLAYPCLALPTLALPCLQTQSQDKIDIEMTYTAVLCSSHTCIGPRTKVKVRARVRNEGKGFRVQG